MIQPHADWPRTITLGAEIGHNTADFDEELRETVSRLYVERHNHGCRSAIDGPTARYAVDAVSQCIRKRIEEAFGWIKSVAGPSIVRSRGLAKVDGAFTFAAVTCNLARIPRLPEAQP